ncbi:hypothetical protein D9613_011240 [Agrocybe pediades]|uniref:Carboxylesterase type B domain-containing protein n=1 Tax=Agrocybe pediades TaxID=84607 RepID=A0A8H4QRL8_9AGAR|nr:hypothetical protein D9613_011240 [Agrocybe pediades]
MKKTSNSLWLPRLLALFFLYVPHNTLALPSAVLLKADIALLVQNDLDNSPTALPKTSTLLLAKAFTHGEAIDACAAVGEQLFTVPVKPVDDPSSPEASANYDPASTLRVNQDLHSIMSTLGLSSRFRKTMFWVEVEDNQGCSVISTHAGLQSVQCDSRLPVLCTTWSPLHAPDDVEGKERARQVEVKSGEVVYTGARDTLSFRFLGIPYADSTPRFVYSDVRPSSTFAEIDALHSKPPCPSSASSSSLAEDCLYLDIHSPYIPTNPARSKMMKPVLVWFDDDNDITGTTKNAGNMVSRNDVVVVRVASRSGILGYLSINDGKTNGNFGLADKITALTWIRAHIADFGGDPTLVTVQGEATTIKALMSAEKAWGLFVNAIIHDSASTHQASDKDTYLTTEESYERYGKKVVDAFGCAREPVEGVLDCLRGVSDVQELFSVGEAEGFESRIVQDGTYVTAKELTFDEPGEMIRVHTMFGWEIGTEDELDRSGEEGESTSARPVGQEAEATGETANKSEHAGIDVDLGFGPGQEVLRDVNSTDANLDSGTVQTPSSSPSVPSAPRSKHPKTLAIKSSKTDLFPSVWAYTYKKEYQSAFYASVPTLPSSSRKEQQQLLKLTQTTTDAIGAFARSSKPNPSSAYLAARGYYVKEGWEEWVPMKAFGQDVTESESKVWPVRVVDVSGNVNEK